MKSKHTNIDPCLFFTCAKVFGQTLLELHEKRTKVQDFINIKLTNK